VEFLFRVYFVTATGAIDTVSYGWYPFPDIPDFFESLAFCNAPACAGASVNLAAKTIMLNSTALAGEGGNRAVLDATITLDRIPNPVATPTPAEGLEAVVGPVSRHNAVADLVEAWQRQSAGDARR
jgi:hypothetical protein